MFVLETDHLTVLERGGAQSLPLQLRLSQIPAREISTTIVNYEEQMRGWLARGLPRQNGRSGCVRIPAITESYRDVFGHPHSAVHGRIC